MSKPIPVRGVKRRHILKKTKTVLVLFLSVEKPNQTRNIGYGNNVGTSFVVGVSSGVKCRHLFLFLQQRSKKYQPTRPVCTSSPTIDNVGPTQFFSTTLTQRASMQRRYISRHPQRWTTSIAHYCRLKAYVAKRLVTLNRFCEKFRYSTTNSEVVGYRHGKRWKMFS